MGSIKQAIKAEKEKGVTIRFEIRTEKTNKEGQAPIRLIFQIKGQRKVYNTGNNILLQSWDSKNQQAIYIDKKTAKKNFAAINYESFLTETEVNEFNQALINVIECTKEITNRFLMDKIVFSSEMVIDKLKENRSSTTKKTEPNTILFDFIDKYINDNEATREPGSLTVYRSMKKHLQAYELKTKKKVTFDKVDYSFFQSFQNFLIGRTKIVAGIEVPMLNNNTIAKQLSTVKTFLNYANKTEGIAVSDTCKNFKIKKDELEVIALTNEEFEALYYFDLTDNKRLAQVRDIFCFSCCTGLRYSDMNQLKWENIKENELMLTVIKTSQKLTVPLNPYSRAILARYEGQRKPLPMISNQKLNDYVKELCKSAGINERIEIVRFRGIIREAITYPKYELIGVHCGRKTYVTLSLEKGMSAEQVMSCTGHKSYSSFKRYINITRTLKIVAVNKAWGEPLSEIKLKAI